MGKASSSKKVARAARAGANPSAGERRDLGFPLALFAIILLGMALVVWARTTRDATAAPRAGEDHWHDAYDIYDCDQYVDPILDESDPAGIHTHADGLIHVHPFGSAASGDQAQLEVFFESYGGSITDSSLTLDTGVTITEGEDCNGKPTVLKVARFDADNRDVDPKVYKSNLGKIKFEKPREAFVIAFVPEDVEVPQPRPERYDQLDRVDPNEISGIDTSVPVDGTTPAPADPASDTTSTVPSSTSEAVPTTTEP